VWVNDRYNPLQALDFASSFTSGEPHGHPPHVSPKRRRTARFSIQSASTHVRNPFRPGLPTFS